MILLENISDCFNILLYLSSDTGELVKYTKGREITLSEELGKKYCKKAATNEPKVLE